MATNVEPLQLRFRYTLEQVKELADLYRLNGRTISQTFHAAAHYSRSSLPRLSFDAFSSVEDVVFLVELIEDIDRIANGKAVQGPLAFTGNADWVIAVNGIVNP